MIVHGYVSHTYEKVPSTIHRYNSRDAQSKTTLDVCLIGLLQRQSGVEINRAVSVHPQAAKWQFFDQSLETGNYTNGQPRKDTNLYESDNYRDESVLSTGVINLKITKSCA